MGVFLCRIICVISKRNSFQTSRYIRQSFFTILHLTSEIRNNIFQPWLRAISRKDQTEWKIYIIFEKIRAIRKNESETKAWIKQKTLFNQLQIGRNISLNIYLIRQKEIYLALYGGLAIFMESLIVARPIELLFLRPSLFINARSLIRSSNVNSLERFLLIDRGRRQAVKRSEEKSNVSRYTRSL